MADASGAAKHAAMGIHAAVLRCPGDVPQTRKVHRVGVHALGTGAQPLHLGARIQTGAYVTPVILAVHLPVYFGGRGGRPRIHCVYLKLMKKN